MSESNLIINNPDALKRHHKITSVGVTLIFWMIVIYLWQPLISLVAWAFGYKLFYEHMLILGGLEGFIEMLVYYLIIVAILGGGLILWAVVNKLRFKNRVRRSGVPAVKPEWVAEHFKITPAEQAVWANSKNLTITISEDSEISTVVNA